MLGVTGRESLILRGLAVPVSVEELSVHLSNFVTQLFRSSRRVAAINYVKVVVRNEEEDVEHCKDCRNDEHDESFQSGVFSLFAA